MQASDTSELAERVLRWQERAPWPVEHGRIATAAITELAGGEPVDVGRVADRAGAPAVDVLDFLRGSPAEF